ncbi:MAG: 1,4-dihydroxy-2-naphthoate polyprenyltransferase [Micrococcaceae bacterium]
MPKPTVLQWIEGARLRTFPLSLSPIVAGTTAAIATGEHSWNLLKALLCFLVALLLQIGVNYSNDYSDGIRGTDDDRVGPLRLTASGVATPEQVKTAAFISFGLACALGILIMNITQSWWLIFVGVFAVIAAWGYTGGKNPYGYRGQGEIYVFIFFGLVATLGTEYVQVGRISLFGLVLAFGIGCFACAVLVANNLRDVYTDKVSGKNTLAVRMGEENSRKFYLALMLIPYIIILPYVWRDSNLLFVYLSLPLAYKPCQTVMSGAKGLSLIPVLKYTGFVSVAYAVLSVISKAGV